MFKKATEDEIFLRNPCDGIVIKIDSQQIKKDILSMDEIKQLALTHYSNENPDIRRAFLFCLYAGLKHTEKYTRAVDSLKREAIDYLSDISF